MCLIICVRPPRNWSSRIVESSIMVQVVTVQCTTCNALRYDDGGAAHTEGITTAGKGTDNCRGNEGLLCSSQPTATATPRHHHKTNIPHSPTSPTSSTHLVRRRGPRSQLSIGRGVKSRCKISHKFWFHGQKSRGTCGIKLQLRELGRTTNPQIGLLFVCPRRIWNLEKSLW